MKKASTPTVKNRFKTTAELKMFLKKAEPELYAYVIKMGWEKMFLELYNGSGE